MAKWPWPRTLLAATAVGAAEQDPSADADPGNESKSYSWGLGIAGLTQQQSYAGNSKGQRISLGFERQYHLGEHLMFTPGAAAIWLDEKYADYYYGVRSSEIKDSPLTDRSGETMMFLGYLYRFR